MIDIYESGPRIKDGTSAVMFGMEEDRVQVDLGGAINDGLDEEKQEKPKQPRKRFIGRRTAAEHAERTSHTNGTIEDSCAVQGRFSLTYIKESIAKAGQ